MYRRMSLLAVFLLLLSVPVFAEELSQQVTRLVDANDADGLRALGDDGITSMVWLYELSEESGRIHIANLFSKMAVQSDSAERALLRDFLSPNLELRLAVQNALGRVSSNPMVVETLLYTLENDRNPLVRDKAAAALAYDQIHLNEQEKVRIYEGLIEALSNPEPQVRAVSIQALSILTGQTKGFHPLYPEDRRERSIAMWQHWLEEHRTRL